MRSTEWWLEQAAHWWVGDVLGQISGGVTWAITKDPNLSAVLAVGLSISAGIVREFVQNVGDKDNSIGDAIFDTVFWSLGAVRSAYPFWILG
jgi:hypothetical protein